jgi:hypothetical protein
MRAFWILRRIIRGYRLADARAALAKAKDHAQARTARRRIVQARGMLSSANEKLTVVRGVSEWLPQDAALRVLSHLAGLGFEITA